jgi:ABC-type phosphate transport system permease subunit
MAIAAPADVRTTVDLALRGKKRDVAGLVFRLALVGTLLVALAILMVLLATTLVDAWPVLTERGWDFVTSDTSALPSRAGVWQGLIGSLILVGFVAVFAIPIGISAAIYLQEYARDTRLNRLMITNIRNLAGVPSVVYGILGLVVFVQALGAITGPDSAGRSYISGGLTLAVLVMPIVILISMEALRAVPKSIREGAYGVGATRWEVVTSCRTPLPGCSPALSWRSRAPSGRRRRCCSSGRSPGTSRPLRASRLWRSCRVRTLRSPPRSSRGRSYRPTTGRRTPLLPSSCCWSRSCSSTSSPSC